MLSPDFYVIIGCDISATGHGREVVYGLNSIEKRFIFQLMSTVKLLGAIGYDTYTAMHTGTRTSNVSLASSFQKHLSTASRKNGVID